MSTEPIHFKAPLDWSGCKECSSMSRIMYKSCYLFKSLPDHTTPHYRCVPCKLSHLWLYPEFELKKSSPYQSNVNLKAFTLFNRKHSSHKPFVSSSLYCMREWWHQTNFLPQGDLFLPHTSAFIFIFFASQ